MIYEVKDWAMESYGSKEYHKFKTSTQIKQVNNYRKLIIEQLIPDIGEKIDNNNQVLGLVKTGIYLHKIKCEDARKLFNFCEYPTIIGYDDLNDSNLKNIVPDSKLEKSKYMRKEWVKEIEFWIKPPLHSKEQTETIKLTEKQRNHAKPRPGHHRLRGAAGVEKLLL